MIGSILGWLLLIIASAIPGLAGFLFEWDRVALSRAYFSLAIGVCVLWWGFSWLRTNVKAK